MSRILLPVLSILFFSTLAHAAETVLVISDIHFDPFADKKLIGKLIEQPVEKWQKIFQSSASKTFSSYRQDTNFALWESALEGMKKSAAKPTTVLVTGDFFRHAFRAEFETIYHDRKGDPAKFKEAFSQFQAKTIQFLAGGLTEQFPDAQFIPVVGNNESSCGDYKVFLHDPFLKDFVEAWQKLSPQSIPKEMTVDFTSSGHYATLLKGSSNIRLIVANDIFLSAEYNGRCGNSMVPPGQGELQWIEQQLTAAEKANEKVWLIAHVPPGLDVIRSIYNSVKGKGPSLTLMMKDDYNQKYLDLLHRHAKNIEYNFTGHNHFGDFRLPGGEVAVLMAPSISPDKTNNPAFQVFDIDTNSGQIKDISQYGLDLASGKSTWAKLLDFDHAFGEKDVTLESLKTVAESLKAGKFAKEYMQMTTSNGEMAKAVMSVASKASICAITEMTSATLKNCAESH